MEYTLYCDESTSKDIKYGDFFGGCIIEAHDLQPVVQALEQCKRDNNLFGEIKWTKLTDTYLEKYQNVIRLFFDFVRQGKVKVRIMFREIDTQYTAYSKDEKYFKLYYQFIKHSFGFTHTYLSVYIFVQFFFCDSLLPTPVRSIWLILMVIVQTKLHRTHNDIDTLQENVFVRLNFCNLFS